jgi:hypothetical protein
MKEMRGAQTISLFTTSRGHLPFGMPKNGQENNIKMDDMKKVFVDVF